MKNLSVKKLTLAGVMAALVFVMTYVPKVPVPVTGGYVHLGDGAIFLAALLLGPLGIPAAALGSGLSDLLGGYMVYVLPTMVIKALVALIAWKGWKEGSWLRAVIAFGFEDLRLNRIEAQHDTANPASGRVMAHVGMQYEGIMRQRILNKGKFVDVACYAILRTDPRT